MCVYVSVGLFMANFIQSDYFPRERLLCIACDVSYRLMTYNLECTKIPCFIYKPLTDNFVFDISVSRISCTEIKIKLTGKKRTSTYLDVQ